MIRLGLFRAGVALAEWLPPGLMYALACVVGLVLSVLPSDPRRRLHRNLRQVLGGAPAPRQLRSCTRRVFQTQAINYVDMLRARVISPEEITRRIRRAGPGWEAFDRTVATRQGAVLVTAHFGQIELLNQYLGLIGVRLTLLVERLRPPALFDLLCRQRTRPTYTLIPFDIGLRPCLRALDRGEVVVFFADWDPIGRGIAVEFFDRPAHLPGGPAHIALHRGVPIFLGCELPDPATGRSLAYMEAPLAIERSALFDDDVQRATRAIARWFQQQIGRYPGQWVMFHPLWSEGKSANDHYAGPRESGDVHVAVPARTLDSGMSAVVAATETGQSR